MSRPRARRRRASPLRDVHRTTGSARALAVVHGVRRFRDRLYISLIRVKSWRRRISIPRRPSPVPPLGLPSRRGKSVPNWCQTGSKCPICFWCWCSRLLSRFRREQAHVAGTSTKMPLPCVYAHAVKTLHRSITCVPQSRFPRSPIRLARTDHPISRSRSGAWRTQIWRGPPAPARWR